MISPSTIASASGGEMPQWTRRWLPLGCGSSSTALIVWLPMSSPTSDGFFPKIMAPLPRGDEGADRCAGLPWIGADPRRPFSMSPCCRDEHAGARHASAGRSCHRTGPDVSEAPSRRSGPAARRRYCGSSRTLGDAQAIGAPSSSRPVCDGLGDSAQLARGGLAQVAVLRRAVHLEPQLVGHDEVARVLPARTRRTGRACGGESG